ncbi:MAG: lipase family protein [Alphaproteobacteria bacterium]|nr:lipase family protein [Alphaproteobacteria bacterium]
MINIKSTKRPDIVPGKTPVKPLTSSSGEDMYASQRAIVTRGLRLSFIVYDPLPHLLAELTRAGFTHIYKLDKKITGTQGFCCVRDNKAYIVFRGTSSLLDWIMDFVFIPFYWPLCHVGFGTAWRSVRSGVKTWLKSLPPEVDSVMLCGHSLGGGICHLAAMDLAKDFKIESVVTFGAPKACYLGTAARYGSTKVHGRDENENLGSITFSVVNQRDIVAKVPFEIIGYRDVGQLVYIDQVENIHFGPEAWKARHNDSMTDADILFNFLEREKIGALGAHSSQTQKIFYKVRMAAVSIVEAAPLLKGIVLPTLMYVMFSFYFLRSGLAHLGDKYMSVFTQPLPEWSYKPYERSSAQEIRALIGRIVFGGLLVGLFLWGLVHIVSWSIEGLHEPENPMARRTH